jgi:hypothetical protein
MAIIKSGNSTDQMTVDPTSKAARVILYDANGNPVSVLAASVIGSPIPSSAVLVAGEGANGNTYPIQTDNNGFIRLDSSSAPNTSSPNRGVQVGGTDGLNFRVFATDILGNQKALSVRNLLQGLYFGSSGILTILAAAHASTAGFLWLINPIGSPVSIYFRKCNFTSATTTALATLSSPRVTMERVTFTGVASGTQITPAKRATSDAAPQGKLLSTSTGLTLTAGPIATAFAVVNNQTAVGTTQPSEQILDTKDDDGLLVLAPGEGLVWRQADAGTTSDTRKINIDLKWEER